MMIPRELVISDNVVVAGVNEDGVDVHFRNGIYEWIIKYGNLDKFEEDINERLNKYLYAQISAMTFANIKCEIMDFLLSYDF